MLTLVLALAYAPSLPVQVPRNAPEVAWRSAPVERIGGQEGRPWLGVGLGGDGDLTVTQVHDGSPAESAGIEVGDRLTSVDGQRLESFADLTAALGLHGPGATVRVELERSFGIEFSDEHRAEDGRPLIGVFLDGNRVTGVQEGHPAQAAGIAKGDAIVAIEGAETPGASEVIALVRAAGEGGGDGVEVRVARQVEVELGARPEALAAPTPVPPRLAPGGRMGQLRGLGVAPEPGAARSGGDGLRDELRSLTSEIAELRAVIAELRAELELLRR